ncbi:hypothetical protein BpHYR1_046408 [Brachionus plicatilis]|uniref:Uncharacterized protein n=1 Tax=Brachionus plicatilis TaxID=10195 RepID=A0A3M7RHC7_BRAPC|nr:hypothetical protein BpHYR1_046408 [Brachionus plicatilis]
MGENQSNGTSLEDKLNKKNCKKSGTNKQQELSSSKEGKKIGIIPLDKISELINCLERLFLTRKKIIESKLYRVCLFLKSNPLQYILTNKIIIKKKIKNKIFYRDLIQFEEY